MSSESVFLDVNVPMYAAGQPHASKDACAWIMTEIAQGRLAAVIDTEIIQEIMYRYEALERFQVAVTMSASLLTLVSTIYPISPADTQLTIQLFHRYASQGIKARDLIHVAVMKNNGLTKVISADKHFDLIDGITRIDPQTLFARGTEK
ncbi:MAG: VapC toxin family PIN domain ribonuclease [Chloroflexota bacterium]|nr:MAG: VapC toxin family PIN domain ribonuclease [Chloroflexota bacterium]